MNLSSTSTVPFNGSRDMIRGNASLIERTAAFPVEVIVTARTTGRSVRITTIVIPPFSLNLPQERK